MNDAILVYQINPTPVGRRVSRTTKSAAEAATFDDSRDSEPARGMNHRKITQPTHSLSCVSIPAQYIKLRQHLAPLGGEREKEISAQQRASEREKLRLDQASQPAEPSNKRIMGGQEEAGRQRAGRVVGRNLS
jgi:hypothetical protein